MADKRFPAIDLAAILLATFAMSAGSSEAAGAIKQDEVKACLATLNSIEKRSARIEAERSELERERQAIIEAGRRISDELASIATTDTKAIADHNARARELNRRVAEFEARSEEIGAASERLQTESSRMSDGCELRALRHASAESADLARMSQCLVTVRGINERKSRLESETAELERERAEIARTEQTLNEEVARIAPTDLAAIAEHNARAEALFRRVEAHTKRSASTGADAERLSADLARLSSACGLEALNSA